jgi:amino acid adenylation domain-containing protein
MIVSDAAGDASGRSDHARLDDLFRCQAGLTPDAVALADGAERWTYAQLDAIADQIAAALAHDGLVPGDLVALRADRRAGTPAAIIGLMRAGAAYLPIHSDDPAERRERILRDSAARAVVSCDLTPRLALDLRRLAGGADQPPPPSGAAYVIYTSGSTGPPKGVVVTHGNVISLLAAAGPLFGFGPDDVWPAFHSFSFDVSVWEMWSCLLHGGRLVIVPEPVATDPYQYGGFLAQTRATVLNQVPTAFGALTKAVVRTRRRLPDIRYVILAGEAIQPPVLRAWRACGAAPQARLINMYGITETTVHSTFADIGGACDCGEGRKGSTFIGRALPHLRIRVVDGNLRDVASGDTGEILIAGAGVAAGYLNRPALTAERFLRGIGDDPDQVWYRSGDLAFGEPDGLWYVGRNDHQVKIRGFRVELGEVEAALRSLPDIDECAVVAPAGQAGQRQLVAFFASSRGDAEHCGQIRQALAGRLPPYMIPAGLTRLPALPHTPSGKIDRRRLEDHWLGRD